MAKFLKKCPKCGRYTISDICPTCSAITKTAHPPSFSLNDKYLKFRLDSQASA